MMENRNIFIGRRSDGGDATVHFDKRGDSVKGRSRYFELIKCFGIWGIQGAGIVLLFFRSLWLCVLVSLAIAIYGVITEKKRAKRRWQNQISIEFREGLQGIAAALQAGYSMENALEESQKDLVLLYGEHSVLVPQMQRMSYELQLNQPIEEVFYRFGQLTQVEDVMRFAQVLHIAKRTGGDLIAITRMTVDRISEKMEVKREILVMIAGKQMEAQIMKLMPLAIILYFWVFSPGFLDPLYRWEGRPVMAVLLLVYLAAAYWINRISRIEI